MKNVRGVSFVAGLAWWTSLNMNDLAWPYHRHRVTQLWEKRSIEADLVAENMHDDDAERQ